MNRLKVLLEEGEMIISESVKQSLLKMNYDVVSTASKYIQEGNYRSLEEFFRKIKNLR